MQWLQRRAFKRICHTVQNASQMKAAKTHYPENGEKKQRETRALEKVPEMKVQLCVFLCRRVCVYIWANV